MPSTKDQSGDKRDGLRIFQELDPALETSWEGYGELLARYSDFNTPSEGEVVRGRVVKITANDVVVDVGYKSEGMIPLQEFRRFDGSVSVEVGDEINVLIEFTEDRRGHIILSREKAEKIGVWEQIQQAFDDQTIVGGVVVDRIKGGLSVDIGVTAFLPGSQADIKPVRNLESLRGTRVECRIIKINSRRGNIVLSRKVVLEDQLNERRRAVLQSLKDGTMILGIIKNLTEYGVFVDLGGIDGLLHVTDIFWGRVSHPSHLFCVGQQIPVKVLKFDSNRDRISLGYKQLQPDPWLTLAEKHPVGAKVQGKIVDVTDCCVFLKIEEGIEGAIPVSELSWSKRGKIPIDRFSVGNPLEAIVLEINSQERRMSLGVKQLNPDPWTILAEAWSVGAVIEGTVRNLTDFGAFVEVADEIDGLVHISDLSWTRKIKHPSEVLRKGERVSAVVIHIDPENQRLSLGIKQLQPDPWEKFFDTHQVGKSISGRIVRFSTFGAFVELESGIEALCHQSQIEEISSEFSGLFVGDVRDFKIVRLQRQERRIGLGLAGLRSVELVEQVPPEKSNVQAIAQVILPTASKSSIPGKATRL